MEITKALFTIVGETNDMALRSYGTHIDNAHVQGAYMDATMGGNNTSILAMSKVAHEILRPQTEINGFAAIANGFAMKRMRFFIEVLHDTGTRQVLSGYTDHIGLTTTAAVDPNMRLYFNQSLMLAAHQATTPNGQQYVRTTVSDASHYLKPVELNNHQLMGLTSQQQQITMRPSDVVETFALVDACREHSAAMGGMEEFSVPNSRAVFDGDIRKSKIKNGHSAYYLSSVMGAMSNAMSFVDGNDPFESVSSTAAADIADTSVAGDRFMIGMGHLGVNLSAGGSCTWGELATVCPEINFISNFNDLSARLTSMHVANTRGVAEHWSGSSFETTIATTVSTALPSIMVDFMLTTLDVTISTCSVGTNNDTVGIPTAGSSTAGIHVQISGANSFAGLNVQQLQELAPRIEQQIASSVALEISQGGQVAVMVHASIDMMGESNIQVGYQGGPLIMYNNPSYCSSLSSPVLTNSQQNMLDVTKDLNYISGMKSAIVQPDNNYYR